MSYETVVRGNQPLGPRLTDSGAKSEVTREQIEIRLPRSAPDALRYEPGVFVQQTAHSQGSVFIRGLTGQQTLIMFDGIRLNNSTYRSGPNQYFFTLDAQTIESIQVLRGGSSTRYGTDALGGVILALPVEPMAAPDDAPEGMFYEPHVRLKTASADRELGGRVQTHVGLAEGLTFFGGVGARRVRLLESGGAVYGLGGEKAEIPTFKEDGRTQLGTQFKEITADGRLVYQVSPSGIFKLAAYAYRLFDAPRTDKCPAVEAVHNECLFYDEQFRTLVYAVFEGKPRTKSLHGFRATVSWQRQREHRTYRRPLLRDRLIGLDVVDTLGATIDAKTSRIRLAPWLRLRLSYGVDTYHDRISSEAWVKQPRIGRVYKESRGQYLDGSDYTYGGAFVEAGARLPRGLRARIGGRVAWVDANAQGDAGSGSEPINETWFPVVGHAGLAWHARPWLRFLGNIDRSFRAPNLNDMTARQQTGPGFQFENAALTPELATTYEAGIQLVGPLRAEIWVFRILIDDHIAKRPTQHDDCPPTASPADQCRASRSTLQPKNVAGVSEIRGAEASVHAQLPWGFTGRATVASTWGEGPSTAASCSACTLDSDAFREPISRVPPPNGTLELLWRQTQGFAVGGALRWAASQDRLAEADVSDARIPTGGTPGFAVIDLRASYRLESMALIALALENVLDKAYRYHGSSVNGPGRGLMLSVDLGPLWRL